MTLLWVWCKSLSGRVSSYGRPSIPVLFSRHQNVYKHFFVHHKQGDQEEPKSQDKCDR